MQPRQQGQPDSACTCAYEAGVSICQGDVAPFLSHHTAIRVGKSSVDLGGAESCRHQMCHTTLRVCRASCTKALRETPELLPAAEQHSRASNAPRLRMKKSDGREYFLGSDCCGHMPLKHKVHPRSTACRVDQRISCPMNACPHQLWTERLVCKSAASTNPPRIFVVAANQEVSLLGAQVRKPKSYSAQPSLFLIWQKPGMAAGEQQGMQQYSP